MCMNTKEVTYGSQIANKRFFIKRITETGVKSNYIGFFYLVLIMDLLINKGYKAKCFYKNIYPIVAKKYNKSVCTVERNIRSLIDKSWENICSVCLICKQDKFAKPTCCGFITSIKNYILSCLN